MTPTGAATAELPPLVLDLEVEALLGHLRRLATGGAVFLYVDGFSGEGAAAAPADVADFEHRLRHFLTLTAILLYQSALPVVKVVGLGTGGGEALSAYRLAAPRSNLIRAYTGGGFADLSNVGGWLPALAEGGLGSPADVKAFRDLEARLQDALAFVRAVLGAGGTAEQVTRAEAFFAQPAPVALAQQSLVAGALPTLAETAHLMTARAEDVLADPDLRGFVAAARNPLLLEGPAPEAIGEALAILDRGGSSARVVVATDGADAHAMAQVAAAIKAHPRPVSGLVPILRAGTILNQDGTRRLVIDPAGLDALAGAGQRPSGLCLRFQDEPPAGGAPFLTLAFHLIELLRRRREMR